MIHVLWNYLVWTKYSNKCSHSENLIKYDNFDVSTNLANDDVHLFSGKKNPNQSQYLNI